MKNPTAFREWLTPIAAMLGGETDPWQLIDGEHYSKVYKQPKAYITNGLFCIAVTDCNRKILVRGCFRNSPDNSWIDTDMHDKSEISVRQKPETIARKMWAFILRYQHQFNLLNQVVPLCFPRQKMQKIMHQLGAGAVLRATTVSGDVHGVHVEIEALPRNEDMKTLTRLSLDSVPLELAEAIAMTVVNAQSPPKAQVPSDPAEQLQYIAETCRRIISRGNYTDVKKAMQSIIEIAESQRLLHLHQESA